MLFPAEKRNLDSPSGLSEISRLYDKVFLENVTKPNPSFPSSSGFTGLIGIEMAGWEFWHMTEVLRSLLLFLPRKAQDLR